MRPCFCAFHFSRSLCSPSLGLVLNTQMEGPVQGRRVHKRLLPHSNMTREAKEGGWNGVFPSNSPENEYPNTRHKKGENLLRRPTSDETNIKSTCSGGYSLLLTHDTYKGEFPCVYELAVLFTVAYFSDTVPVCTSIFIHQGQGILQSDWR